MKTAVVPFDFHGQQVQFNSDGWINATAVAAEVGKRLDHWLANAETNDYMEALASALNTRDSGDLIFTKRGRNGGTWLHPKLAIVFARWLSADFAVWCDLQIDELLHGGGNAREMLDKSSLALDRRRELASQQGKGLSAWRWARPELEQSVEFWREQVQLTLKLDAP
ncbi:KilA-N domain-containing protein [Pseudomonas yamanorum]|uniref:KilA-N domain-containing protein n=1 Tax=Pseudomonas yamanorum TaxID=515393 RepID=UPI003BA1E85B